MKMGAALRFSGCEYVNWQRVSTCAAHTKREISVASDMYS